MITIIIFSLIGIAIGIYKASKDSYPIHSDYIVYTLFWLLIGWCFGLLVSIVIPHGIKTTYETSYIETLNDNSSTGGVLFLGSGHIDGSMKYTFYCKVEDGFKMKQIDYDRAKIVYSNDLPRVDKVIEESDNLFSIHIYKSRYIIYVPKGTIQQNYNLDAK